MNEDTTSARGDCSADQSSSSEPPAAAAVAQSCSVDPSAISPYLDPAAIRAHLIVLNQSFAALRSALSSSRARVSFLEAENESLKKSLNSPSRSRVSLLESENESLKISLKGLLRTERLLHLSLKCATPLRSVDVNATERLASLEVASAMLAKTRAALAASRSGLAGSQSSSSSPPASSSSSSSSSTIATPSPTFVCRQTTPSPPTLLAQPHHVTIRSLEEASLAEFCYGPPVGAVGRRSTPGDRGTEVGAEGGGAVRLLGSKVEEELLDDCMFVQGTREDDAQQVQEETILRFIDKLDIMDERRRPKNCKTERRTAFVT